MTKHVFNSDIRLIGIFGGKKFEKKIRKLFYLMKEIFDRNPFEENPCQIFEAKIFWLPIMYILMCRNIFFPKWGLIGFRLRFMHPDAWYSAAYSYNSYFEDFYLPNWPIHKSWIIKIWKTTKMLFWRFLDGFWAVLGGFKAVFDGFGGYIVVFIISIILSISNSQNRPVHK